MRARVLITLIAYRHSQILNSLSANCRDAIHDLRLSSERVGNGDSVFLRLQRLDNVDMLAVALDGTDVLIKPVIMADTLRLVAPLLLRRRHLIRSGVGELGDGDPCILGIGLDLDCLSVGKESCHCNGGELHFDNNYKI